MRVRNGRAVLVAAGVLVAGLGGLSRTAGAPVPKNNTPFAISAEDRGRSLRNLGEIAKALHNHASASADGGTFPHDSIRDPKGKPLLSWRVAILPFLKVGELQKEFRLDEPWDSEHNRKLIPKMPKTFATPGLTPPAGHTYYKVFVGGGAWFGKPFPPNLNRVVDGTTNTILVAEAGDPVPWTKPEDIPYDPKKPLPKLTLPGAGDTLLVAVGDGSTRPVDLKKVSEETLRAAITDMGQEILGKDWDE